ncbi:MAG: hypothetical protein AAF191_09830 [Verrucomicrobiota bacterium]
MAAPVILSPQSSLAEGSCHWDDGRALLEQAPAMLEYVEQSLDVESFGFALRLGPHFPDLSGTRVAPYTFRAQSKFNEDHWFELVLEADLTFFDAQGAAIETGDPEEATQIRQAFTGLTLRPVEVEMGTESLEVLRSAEEDLSSLSELLTTDAFRRTAVSFSGGSAEIFHHQGTDDIASILVRPEGSMSEQFFFRDRILLAVETVVEGMAAHPEATDADVFHVREETYYLEQGELLFAIEQSYQATTREGLAAAKLHAPKSRMALSGSESIQFLARASRLLATQAPESFAAAYQTDL